MWRCTNPALDDSTRRAAVKELMQGRRGVQLAKTEDETRQARASVDAAKRRLGERGPVWWQDDSPDEGGKHPRNTIYAEWWASLDEETRAKGDPPKS